MHRILLALIPLMLQAQPLFADSDLPQDKLSVLMTVGGVGYNTSIVRMLLGNPSIELTVRSVDDDNIVFTPGALADTDALLMYHRDNIAEGEEREALMHYLRDGGGVVVLHHAIANYPDWQEWWRDHVGGLYVLPGHEGLTPSRYFYGFQGVARPATNHPVTNRLGDFWRYADESYDQLWVSDDVDPLLTTTAFGSESRLAWIGPSDSRRVVFIQPGHGEAVLTDPKYLMLIEDALRWSARTAE